MSEPTMEQDLLSRAALASFRLNGQFLSLAEGLSRPVGLTAARWQVLGAILDAPLSVSDIARAMGLSRQAVQRIADRLVHDGLASYHENPTHRRAKLLSPTEAGRDAVQRINPAHRHAALALIDELGATRAADIVTALSELSDAMEQLAISSASQ